MKTRLLVHIALNAKGERVNILVSSGGLLIPFQWDATESLAELRNRKHDFWLAFDCYSSLREWKEKAKQIYQAVRFQRVILEGEVV